MKTAMQELKWKLEIVISELEDVVQGTDQYGYRDALKNVVTDIDVQMLDVEKQQIVNAWESAYFGDSSHAGDDYFKNTFVNPT